MPASQVSGLGSRLVLAKNRDDLLLREPLPLHSSVSLQGRTLNLTGGNLQW